MTATRMNAPLKKIHIYFLHSRSITGSSTVAITSASPKRSGLKEREWGDVGRGGRGGTGAKHEGGFEISP